jgi:hypothetical protein
LAFVCGGCEPAASGEKRAFVSFGLQKKEIHFLCGLGINRKIEVLMIIIPLIAAGAIKTDWQIGV